jgi:hypothetical protein
VTLTRQAQDKKIPTRVVLRDTLRWLFPFTRVPKAQLVFTAVSFVFHIGIIVVPIFLGAQILLWENALGVSWPAIPQGWADTLTLVVVAASIVLFARRLRSIDVTQPCELRVTFIAVPFISGYLATPSYQSHAGNLMFAR